MHAYKIVENAIDAAVHQAAEHGWPEHETIRSLIVSTVQRLRRAAGATSTRSILEFEISNLSGTVDYDFVRSR